MVGRSLLQAFWHAAQRSIFFWVAHLEWICSLCILGSPPPIRALDASGTGGPASVAHLQVYSWTVSRRLIGRSASCRFLTGPTTRTVTLPSPKATGGVSVFGPKKSGSLYSLPLYLRLGKPFNSTTGPVLQVFSQVTWSWSVVTFSPYGWVGHWSLIMHVCVLTCLLACLSVVSLLFSHSSLCLLACSCCSRSCFTFATIVAQVWPESSPSLEARAPLSTPQQ